MRAKTELLLYRLSRMGEMMIRPSLRTMDSSFESWAYGNGLLRQIQRLEAQAYLESKIDPESGARLVRLTEKGAAVCHLDCDPEARWNREWDGRWRMVIFDVPEADRKLRSRIRRRLFSERFGCLQQSVWISPSPFGGMIDDLRGIKVDGGSLTLMEGTSVAGETPADLVSSAWNFEPIHRSWEELSNHLELGKKPLGESSDKILVEWLAQERRLVRRCLSLDPLLPVKLLPEGYPGRKVWKKRGDVLAKLSMSLE
jgi:phenylacetic acid degradation operon negative regulatory protein